MFAIIKISPRKRHLGMKNSIKGRARVLTGSDKERCIDRALTTSDENGCTMRGIAGYVRYLTSSVIGLSQPVHEYMLLTFSFFLVSNGQFGGSHSVNTLELNHKEVFKQGVAA